MGVINQSISLCFVFLHIHANILSVIRCAVKNSTVNACKDGYHWVPSKRHRLCFSTKTCSCYSTITHINSVILILRLNLTSLRNIYIKMCVVLNEDHF